MLNQNRQHVGTHLADTVQRHLSPQSQLWWLIDNEAAAQSVGLPGLHSLEPGRLSLVRRSD